MTRALVVHSGNILGGVETVLSTLARMARERQGLALEFALAFEGPFAERLRADGASVVIVGPARFSRPLEIRAMRRRLAAHLAAEPVDVVLTQSAWSHAAMGPVARQFRLPLAHWVHDVLDGAHWLQWMAARVVPDLLVCNSQFSARAASAVFRGAPTTVVYAPIAPAPIDATAREQVRRATETSSDAVVILQVGRTDPLKGHAVLVGALRQLPRELPWICWLVGAPQNGREAKYWRAIADQVRAAGLGDRVRWLGQRADVARVLSAADIYCQPNVGPEAFGLTLAEASNAGLPVVTSALGGALEIVSDSTGVLLPTGDADALARALGDLIADGSRRHALGSHGPERVRALCDPERSLAALTAALDQLRAARAA